MPPRETSYTRRSDSGEAPERDAWAALSEAAFAEDWGSGLDTDYHDWERAYGHLRSTDDSKPSSDAKD